MLRSSSLKKITGTSIVAIVTSFALVSGGCRDSPGRVMAVPEVSPDQWSQADRERALAAQRLSGNEVRAQPNPSLVTAKAMIAGTTPGPFAVHAGLEVLKHGGSAADAALATALAQIALTAGNSVSYAGIMSAVYYDAASRQVFALDAPYNTVKHETNPLTIPSMRAHSGRTALVPGFMAGVQALHNRFGRLPFAAIFAPAIWIAAHGVPLDSTLTNQLQADKDVLARLPETKRIFTKPNGQLYWFGDNFRQPQLAATLTAVATRGSAYMYTGDWARHFVAAVRREGGAMTLEDLVVYQPLWTEPVRTLYHGYEVVSVGSPNVGGLDTLSALRLVDASHVTAGVRDLQSGDALYALIQISRLQSILALRPGAALQDDFPDVDLSAAARLGGSTAEQLWARIQQSDWQTAMTRLLSAAVNPNHSAGVLAVDANGNVAAILHSCNCFGWGSSGIFVDGVSVPDSATLQQRAIAAVGPGVPLPEPSNPIIVLRDGMPVLALTGTGTLLPEMTLQNLVNILDFGMDPKTAIEQPHFYGPFYERGAPGSSGPAVDKEMLREGDFSQQTLERLHARGQAVQLVRDVPPGTGGEWIAIQIDVTSHKRAGGVPAGTGAHLEGF